MKIKIEDLKNCQKALTIEVEQDRVESVLNDVYDDMRKTACIPGFRVGKAPRDLLEAHHSDTANSEAVNRLISDCFRQAVIEKKLDIIGHPHVEDVSFGKGKPLIFKIKIDVRPDIALKTYKGLKLKRPRTEVKDDDVDLALKQIQESMAAYKNIDGRAIKSGDYVVCDYECRVEGKLVDKKDKLWLYISDQLQPKQLYDALLSAEKESVREFEADHPQDYHFKVLAGKKAHYKVTPLEIKEKILPEINDDLAKSSGKFTTLEELKNGIRQNLQGSNENRAEAALREQAFDIILKAHQIEIPDSLVQAQLKKLIEDTKTRLLYQGYDKKDIDSQDENLSKNLLQNAKDSVRLFFIIDEIAKKEQIKADEKDIDERILRLAQQAKADPKEARKKLQESHLIDDIAEQIVHDKVIDFIISKADIEKP